MGEDLWRRLEAGYRPRARFAHARVALAHARAAIDTSDGFLAAVDMLTRLAGAGAHLALADEHYQPELVGLSREAGFPLWIGGAFGMGEYELLLAIPPEREGAFLADLEGAGLAASRVGTVRAAPVLTMELHGAPRRLDGARLLNLLAESGDVERYVEALLAMDAELAAAPPDETPA